MASNYISEMSRATNDSTKYEREREIERFLVCIPNLRLVVIDDQRTPALASDGAHGGGAKAKDAIYYLVMKGLAVGTRMERSLIRPCVERR